LCGSCALLSICLHLGHRLFYFRRIRYYHSVCPTGFSVIPIPFWCFCIYRQLVCDACFHYYLFLQWFKRKSQLQSILLVLSSSSITLCTDSIFIIILGGKI